MNKNYTLKELADIGVKAANSTPDGSTYIENAQAFTKAVLDAVGYEFPKDEEREAFERWQKSHTVDPNDAFFDVWKAGCEELRRAQLLDKQPTEPAWIPWGGGECPLPDGVKRWEAKCRDGVIYSPPAAPRFYTWSHEGICGDIVAYRVIQ